MKTSRARGSVITLSEKAVILSAEVQKNSRPNGALSRLNKKMNAEAGTIMAAAEANTRRLTGKSRI